MRIGNRAEGERGVTIGDEPVLVVIRQRPNRADLWRAAGVAVPDDAQAVPGGQASIGRLCPGGAGIEREVDAGRTDARRERTSVVRSCVASFQVDVVVGAGDKHVRMIGIHRQRRLVLLVL